MNYKDVLDKYKENLPNNRKWWPNFLYHFTDVHNASRQEYYVMDIFGADRRRKKKR